MFLQVLALKSLFHPQGLLPLMLKQVSWPILNSLHSSFDLLPDFFGAASFTNNTSDWKGACFYGNKAWIVFHNKTGSQFGGGTLHIKVAFFFYFLPFILVSIFEFQVYQIWWYPSHKHKREKKKNKKKRDEEEEEDEEEAERERDEEEEEEGERRKCRGAN